MFCFSSLSLGGSARKFLDVWTGLTLGGLLSVLTGGAECDVFEGLILSPKLSQWSDARNASFTEEIGRVKIGRE